MLNQLFCLYQSNILGISRSCENEDHNLTTQNISKHAINKGVYCQINSQSPKKLSDFSSIVENVALVGFIKNNIFMVYVSSPLIPETGEITELSEVGSYYTQVP